MACERSLGQKARVRQENQRDFNRASQRNRGSVTPHTRRQNPLPLMHQTSPLRS